MHSPADPVASHSTPFPRGFIAPVVFATLVIAMFGDVLISAHRVLSSSSTDLALQFIPWRHFGFEQMRQGNLPLWNPHIYGGTPYFAGFQAALLYPPNWLHLILPVSVAINWIIALHVFAAGYFTYLWCRARDVSIAGSILAGMMFMFGGPYFLHIYAGHLPHLAVMVWAPLILLSIDKLAREGSIRWAFLGVICVAMQVLAGHPQYVYYTGIACAVYMLLLLISSRRRVALSAGFVVIWLGGAMLSAVQLLPGIDATREFVRASGTSYEFASTFSLPPTNLITLIAPKFFGNVPEYWGPGYLWEMCLFISVSGVVLAVVAVVLEQRWEILIALIMVGITLLLALGRHTPLYRVMYEFVPYYGSFRGTVKFAYIATLFAAVLAGSGFDALMKQKRASWRLITSVAVGCVAVLVLAAWVTSTSASGTDGAWGRFVQALGRKYSAAQELFTRRAEAYQQAEFIQASGVAAARWLCWAAATGTALIVILIGSRVRAVALYALIALALVELFIFARWSRATMDPAALVLPEPWRQPLEQLEKDRRVLTVPLSYANSGMSFGFDNLNGYDPGVLKRYAELIYASQGLDPAGASQYLPFLRGNLTVFPMLRCELICFDVAQPPLRLARPMPLAAIVGYWVVLPTREASFAYILKDDFDPRVGVVLEADPGLSSADASAAGGSVEVISRTTGSVELRAQLAHSSILLITNNYAPGWRVRSLSNESPQPSYRIIPANYTLQGIPLEPGTHHLLVEYAPRSFRVGLLVTSVSIIVVGILGGWMILRLRSRKQQATFAR